MNHAVNRVNSFHQKAPTKTKRMPTKKLLAFSGFTLATSANGQCIKQIRKFQTVMFLPISGNSYKIIII